MTLDQVAAVTQAAGVIFLLTGALFGLYKRWWVPGWVYIAMEKERDYWRDTALLSTRTAGKVVEKAEADVS